MRAIADEAGIAAGCIYLYFPAEEACEEIPVMEKRKYLTRGYAER